MEFRQLRYFLALSRTLNFTRAAEEMHIAQPPLSRQISQLEAELSTRLIDRDVRPMKLTSAGEYFRDRAADIVARLEQLQADTRAIGQTRVRTLRLGVEPSILYGRFSELIRQLRGHSPHLRVKVTEMAANQAVEKLSADEIDIALTRAKISDRNIEQLVLREEPLVVALSAGHRLAIDAPAPLRFSDLRDDTVILFPAESNTPYRRSLGLLFARRDFVPNEIIEAGEMQAALGLVAADSGVSIVPAAVQRMRPDDICYRMLGEPGAISQIIMTYLRNGETEVTRTVRRLLLKISA